MNLAFSVQSNHFNMDPEGVIESVHIRAFLSQGTKQTVRNNEVSVLSRKVQTKTDSQKGLKKMSQENQPS